ncbi:vWA domain-containing protein [Bordetella petrii]|uniref:vWA domain-containing protein n=1 Tax=Bordetella petrii TaxID=94624 RepID=UPI000479D625|nr:VWA domain-containing protein [Bordetella petrii]
MKSLTAPARLLCTAVSAALLAACSPPPTDRATQPATSAPTDRARETARLAADSARAPAAPAPQATLAAPAHQYAPRAHAEPAPLDGLRRTSIADMALPSAVDRENYQRYRDNPVVVAREQPVSTFGVDVDTGSYTNVRRILNEGRLPPAHAVRAEEFINYFDYGYAVPDSPQRPFHIHTELAAAPWNPQRQLLQIGVQGYEVAPRDIPAANLVFLIDTSGSMADRDKLPLLKAALRQLVKQLRPQDRVAIVTYAGQASTTLESTPGDQQARILAAIDSLRAAGGTNGAAGLDLAYAQAAKAYVPEGVNRILLASDGDFNVGTTDLETLKERIARHRQNGIALTTLGVGGGNFNDALAMQLADVGDGSYHYLDSLREAQRVLAREVTSTLLTIARDVKIQVEFNPALVAEYRLIGYEKRALAREDFNNDRVDAGDIGAGASVTALYEITPVGAPGARLDPLRYGQAPHIGTQGHDELAFVRLRYKLPGSADSQLLEHAVAASQARQAGSAAMQRAAAAAAFAQWLRGGKYLDGYTPGQIEALARRARGDDAHGINTELAALVDLAAGLGAQAVP